ncbi:MAG TPA: hypothetical protein DIU15_09680 [Deltaproteobacteria bacterium]|nr:hypothetical protein [Deltaproteobacteria bacterium]HCP46301.1 hypothetical protein [Deltaproteobacteria bacterium]
MLDLLIRFQNMDRRWVFLGMALAIVLPMLVPFSLPFKVDQRVQDLYDRVEALEAGDTVYISADFDPGSRPELEPFFRTHLHHLFRQDVRVVMGTLWATAPPLVKPILEDIAQEYGKEYGKDWTFLGYVEGKELAIKSLGQSVRKTYPLDDRGNKTADLAVMAGLDAMRDFDILTSVSAGFPGTQAFVLQIQGQYNLEMASACTAVSAPDYIPYYQSGQLFGLSGGMPGSAQYEKLVYASVPPEKRPRLPATSGMNVLSIGHLYIIILLLLGNLAFFLTRGGEEN